MAISDKVVPILESLNHNVLLQTSWMESMFMTDSIMKDNIESQTKSLEIISDSISEQERNQRLRDIPQQSNRKRPGSSTSNDIDEDNVELPGLGRLLTAGAIAPFAFSFIKGFLTEITDGLIEITPSGVLAALRLPDITKMFGNIGKSFLDLEKIAAGPIGKVIDSAGTLISTGGEKLSKIFNPIKSVFQSADDIMRGPFAKIFTFFSGGVAKIAGLFGKLVWPLSIVMGAIDGVREFRETEGTLLERLGAGIGGFLGEIVGAPFDLLKNAVNWILKRFFGIEVDENGNATPGQGLMGWVVTRLNNFSFEETIGSIVSGIFSMVQDAIDWVGELFTDPTEALKSLWRAYIGVWSGIGQWIYDNTIDPAWTWFKGLFDWNAEDEESADTNIISQIFNDTIENVKQFFTDLFDFIPTLDEIKDTLTSMLPQWMRPESIEQERLRLEEELAAAERRRNAAQRNLDSTSPDSGRILRQRRNELSDRQSEVDEIQRQLAELPELRRGGIFNADSNGSPAMLHGQEAVIPLESSRGQQILETKTNILSSGDAQKASASIVLAPGGSNVNAPQTTNNSNVTINNSVNPAGSLSRKNARAN